MKTTIARASAWDKEALEAYESREKDYRVCASCGKRDISSPGHVGTSTKMACPDCSGSPEDPRAKAKLCRACCPTGHRTRWTPNPISAGGKAAIAVGLAAGVVAVLYYSAKALGSGLAQSIGSGATKAV